MQCWYEWGVLIVGSDIVVVKIGNNVDVGVFSQYCRVLVLVCIVDVVMCVGLMMNCLFMGVDGLYVVCGQICIGKQLGDVFGVDYGQCVGG